MSEGVIGETERALADHELIKVRISSTDREDRVNLGQALAEKCGAEIIQRIGKVIILFRANPKPNVKLSNLHRYSGGS